MTAIEPRTRKSSGRRSGTGVPPALIFFGLVVCIACGWLGQQVAGPLQQAARLHGENDAIERDLRRREIRNQEARKQAEAILTDAGAIAAARAKGYMYRYERPLRVQNATTAVTGVGTAVTGQ